MLNENFEQWYKNKNLFAQSNEWNKQMTDFFHLCQHMAQKNLEITNENIFRTFDQIKRLTNVKKPEEFLSLSREFANENMSAYLQNIQALITICNENLDEYMKLCKPLYDVTSAFTPGRDTHSSRNFTKEKASSKE